MKKILLSAGLIAGLLVPSAAVSQKGRYSSSGQVELDYPLVIHVTRSWLVTAPGSTDDQAGATDLHLDVLADGSRYELRAVASGLLHPGDYRARELRGTESKGGWFSRGYELRFNDGTHVVFKVVGESSN
ncbi:MAG: hypothetical protein PW792_13360 [Acidobacteriaceae bacterium]|nr:hypothetical protein [Acidobacteriaceae bacterium]